MTDKLCHVEAQKHKIMHPNSQINGNEPKGSESTTGTKSHRNILHPIRVIFFYFKQIIRLIQKPKKVAEIIKTLFKAFYVFRHTPIKELKQIYRIVILKNFFLTDAFRWGLLNPEVSTGEIDKNMGTRMLHQLRAPYIPRQCTDIARDKSLFYKYCAMLNIPAPKLYAAIYPGGYGWSYVGKYLSDKSEWLNFISHQFPPDFVIKPTRGEQGSSIRLFSRKGDNFIETPSGKSYEAVDIYHSITNNKTYDSYIIQERLYNHDDIKRINNSNFLQTIRIITIIDKFEHVRIPYAILKINNSDDPADNYHHGITGNYCCLLDVESGKLTECYIDTDGGYGPKLLGIHPQTKIKFEGYQLPFWEQALGLVIDAATKFTPPRTYGWDIAITNDGPFIVEGNNYYAPFWGMGAVQKALKKYL